MAKKSSTRLVSVLFGVALASISITARADCFDDAAAYHHVNPWILRAIAARESGFKPNIVVRNSNNSVDIGQAGINSVHLPELAKYGIGQADLLDGCKSTYVSGWHLAKKIRRFGNSWTAVGAYNSETPSKRDIYAEKIRTIIEFWIAKGIIREQAP
jgi:soluble lytic murein transglycosylase-like protein